MTSIPDVTYQWNNFGIFWNQIPGEAGGRETEGKLNKVNVGLVETEKQES